MQHSTLEKVQVQLIAFMTHIFIGLVQSITHTLGTFTSESNSNDQDK